jgi:biopolymer transport protein ExbD
MKQTLLEHTDKSVFVRADAAVTMQQFMSVTDKLKDAGVEKVAISTRPPER